VELDHIFICVEELGAAERTLADFGLQFSVHAVHPGQGTVNACALFENAYLELLGRHDDQELQSPAVRPLALGDRLRWHQSGASPFGIALRTAGTDLSFSTWPYEAAYLPPGTGIPIVTAPNSGHEPLVFLITPALRIRLPRTQAHRGKPRRLTQVKVSVPGPFSLSAEAKKALCDSRVLVVDQASEHKLELEWDGGSSGQSQDFGSRLPLLLKW
jgi:hypothetical protein